MPERAPVAGAVLAAGAGTRMGTPKGEIVLDGRRLVDRGVSVLAKGGCSPVVAVVRPGVHVPGATVIANPDAARGMRSSLRLAVDAACDAAALVVLLADLPGVTGAAVRHVVDAWRPGRVALARYRDGSGHPVVMSPDLWRAALALADDDRGARAYLAANPGLVDEVEVAGSARDLDTPAELARWAAGAVS